MKLILSDLIAIEIILHFLSMHESVVDNHNFRKKHHAYIFIATAEMLYTIIA